MVIPRTTIAWVAAAMRYGLTPEMDEDFRSTRALELWCQALDENAFAKATGSVYPKSVSVRGTTRSPVSSGANLPRSSWR